MTKGKRILFNSLSFLFLITLVVFYGYRLFYFYKIEHVKVSDGPQNFSQILIQNVGIEGMKYGLQKDGNNYYFESDSFDNYLTFQGRTWRIIGIDENKNIKAITDEVQTILYWNDDTTFEDSDINKWLIINEEDNSGIFEKSLKGNTFVTNISLLTPEEYKKLENKNFLVGDSFWLNSDDKEYVDTKGEIKTEEDDDIHGVRPVITISSDAIYISGSGTEQDPYVIDDKYKEKLADAFVGEYLTYNDETWRIIAVNEDSVKVVLNNSFENEDITFSNNNEFSLTNGAGKYLNDEYYKQLDNNDYIIEKEFNIGTYEDSGNYSYLNTYNDTISAYVGLYQIGDFFISSDNNFYTLTPSDDSSNVIYTVKNKKLFIDFVTSNYNIKPVINLDSEIFILKGNGTLDDPYEIGR